MQCEPRLSGCLIWSDNLHVVSHPDRFLDPGFARWNGRYGLRVTGRIKHRPTGRYYYWVDTGYVNGTKTVIDFFPAVKRIVTAAVPGYQGPRQCCQDRELRNITGELQILVNAARAWKC